MSKKEKSLVNSIYKGYIIIFVLITLIMIGLFLFMYQYITNSLITKITTSYEKNASEYITDWINQLNSLLTQKKIKILKQSLLDASAYLKKNKYNFGLLHPYFNLVSKKNNIDINYYIIGPNGIVKYTNYPTDLGFNFVKMAPNVYEFLKKLKANQIFVSPISIETTTKYAREYAYYKFSNGYILEVGIKLNKVNDLKNSIKKRIEELAFIKNFDIFYEYIPGKYKSLITAKAVTPPKNLNLIVTEEELAFSKLKSTNTFYFKVSNKELNLNIYAKTVMDFNEIYRQLYTIFYTIGLLFIGTGLIVFFLVYSNTKRFVSTIKTITTKIKSGNYTRKKLQKTNIREINYFIQAHNTILENLNQTIGEEYTLNEKLLTALKETDLEREKYKNLFNSIPNPTVRIKLIFEIDKFGKRRVKDGMAIDVNEKFIRTFNVSTKINGRKLSEWKAYGKEKVHNFIVKNILQPSVNGNNIFDIKMPISKRWFRIFSSIENENTLLLILADIDEIKKMQLRLQANEEKLNIAMNAAEEAIWEYDYSTERFFITEKGWQMLGYEQDPSNSSFLFWKTIMHPVDRKRVLRLERKWIEGTINDFRIIVRLKTKLGNYKWIEVLGKVIQRDEHGKAVKLVGIRRDVDKYKRLNDKIKEAEERYRELINNTISAVAIYKAINNGDDFEFIEFNNRGCEIEKVKKEDVIGKTLKEIFPPAVKEGFLDILKDVYESSKPRTYLLHFIDNDGQDQWRENYVFKLSNGEIVAVYQDITQEKKNQQTIELLSLALQKSKNSIYIADNECHIIWVNKEFERITGYGLEELKGKSVWEIYRLPKDRLKEIYQELKENDLWRGEIKLTNSSGQKYWERCFMSAIRENGKVAYIVKVGEDITKEKELQQRLEEYANIDELTKVLNRRAGYLLLENELKMARRKKTPLTIAFIDMDNLKKINDSFGHEKGDESIIAIVKILQESIRETDAIMRIGGDEFVILFPESTTKDVELIFESRVKTKIEKYNKTHPSPIELSISYGLSQYNNFDKEFDIEKLIQKADDLMYEMKKEKKVQRD